MNHRNRIGLDSAAQSAQDKSHEILYFRFRQDIGSAIEQVEYDLLQTNLSQHRGYDAAANALCRDGYRAVVATSETGVGDDAIAYTTNYLRSMPTIDAPSITTLLPLPNPS